MGNLKYNVTYLFFMDLLQFLLSNSVIITGNCFEKAIDHLEYVFDKRVWVCDFRLNNYNDLKPIRKIPPTLVQVFSNEDLPDNKRIYYSPIHFRVVKKGKVTSKIIAPYDNTGYRIYPGVSINIFETEKDCVECFNNQCDAVIEGYLEELNRRTFETQKKIEDIRVLMQSRYTNTAGQ